MNRIKEKTNNRREQKSLSYIINVPMRHGELTVMGAESAEDSMIHSIRLANETRKAGLGVLVINCGMSNRRFREHFAAQNYQHSHENPQLVIHTSVRGNLAAEREAIEEVICHSQIRTVILVGWEWAADSRKRRARLLTFLRELMDVHDIITVVYATTMNELKAGRMDRGGLGKLTLLAYAVGHVESSETLEEVAPRKKPIVAYPDDLAAATRGVHELMRKVNELEGENPDEGSEVAIAA